VRAKEFKKINEMPQIIQPLTDPDTEETRRFCVKALNNKSATLVEPISASASLYHTGNDDNGIYFSSINNEIGYFAKYKKVTMHIDLVPNESGIRQVLINSYSNMGPAKTGVGKLIFWEHLFPKFHTLISDSQQTENGRSFWEYRIAEAFDKKLLVRMINTSDRTYVDLESPDQMHSLSSKIWGTQNWFQRIILIIMAKQ
jgi:hypothetical protein